MLKQRIKVFWVFFISFWVLACSPTQKRKESRVITEVKDSSGIEQIVKEAVPLTGTARYLDSLGLINVATLDSTLVVDLMYATSDNFTGEILYEDLTEAYLIPQVAEAVMKAQQLLKNQFPAYSLIIYDAARPMSVQQKMWDVVKGTFKYRYVSNPAKGGGLHNYGLAVDVSILNEKGDSLPMGTLVDHLGFESHITQEDQFVRNGILSMEEKHNRELLRDIMKKVGFYPLSGEWWHFNWCSRKEALAKYTRIE